MYGSSEWTERVFEWTVAEGMQGRYNLVFYWKNNASGGNQPPAAIDDIAIVKSACTTPQNLKAYNITETTAELTWLNYNSNKWYVKVFDTDIPVENVEEETALYNFEVTEMACPLTNLTIGTRYYYYVKADCENTWVKGNFMTTCNAYEFPYTDDFNGYGGTGSAYFPECWTKLVLTASLTNTYLTSEGNNNASLAIHNGSITSPGFSMAVTPPLAIDSIQKAYVAFDVRGWSNGYNNALIVGLIEDQEDYDTFVPVDTIWIPYNSNWIERQEVYFSNYEGEAKRIGFQSLYDTSYENIAYAGVHIDNLRVGVWEEFHYETSQCEGYNYRGYGFDIPREELSEAGEFIFKREALNQTVGNDSIVYLHFTVTESVTEIINAVICEGETYTEYGFNASEEDEYRLSFRSDSGCDSTLILYLKVNPKYEFRDTITTCLAALPYIWRGKEYTETGVYRDSLQTVLLGCDSIYVLDLSVVREDIRQLDVTICSNENYFFKGEYLTAAGTYIDTLMNVNGCDSIVTLNLTVNEAYNLRQRVSTCRGVPYSGYGFENLTTTGEYIHEGYSTVTGCDSIFILDLYVVDEVFETIRDTICEGSTYKLYGFDESETGTYYQYLKSSAGCDSTVTLHLTVMPAYEYEDLVIIQKSDLPYDYDEHTSFDENTVSGTHRLEYTTTFGCDSIINLTLIVEDGSGLLNLYGEYFDITPNPVKTGGPAYINYDFSETEKEGLYVEIFNGLGTFISRIRPEQYPINIGNNFKATGIYIVRIITGDKKVLYGKIIVTN